MSLERYFNKGFRFKANRFEEWQGGRCISSGDISTEIIVADNSSQLKFILESKGDLAITPTFIFEKALSQILPDRIQYVRQSDFNPIEPIVCHIFTKDDELNCIRFAMTNPDRIIEFYGGEMYTRESLRNFLFDALGLVEP